ncbi:MAG: tripartite tricarboxylate transporter substrate binding protein [Bullifex sp.]|nr:tripartite tricarboxylate transporter substrate binding protein [Spirochaetales bacterium]MDY5777826.1 tripartite tricarboxylate transporter substrate binding protein [Bullifex sp.]
MKKLLIVLLLFVVVISSLFAQGAAEASAYPEKAITMIIPYGAGGTTDVSGRKFAALLSKELGVAVTVVNQGGASGSIGCQAALDADPDGYTVLFTAESLGTQRVMGLTDLSYDNYKIISTMVNDPKVIVVAKDSKYSTLADLLADMKANPGKIKMSYTGPGGSGHVQGLIMEKLGYVPALTAYSSGADCYRAVLSGEVAFTNSNISTVKALIQSGDLRLLGVSSNVKLSIYPDAPLFEEVDPAAAPYMKNAFTPLNFLVSNQVDDSVVEVLRNATKKVVESAEWKSFIKDNALEELYLQYPTVEATKEFYKNWESMVSWMLFDAGVTKYSPADFGIAKP